MEKTHDLPFHLKGNYAPVDEERTAFDLPVEGRIPPELRGVYMRNGPNPRSGESSHWFSGDGMLHALRLENGRAVSYRNRWVRTRVFEDPDLELISEDGQVDRTVAVANTHIIRHNGEFLALVESSFPTKVTAELETVGLEDYDGQLGTGMTAHPKTCPQTGELHFFGYGFFEPYLVYHRASASGELLQSQPIDVHGPTMIHDFAITENYVVFMDLPVVFDLEKAMQEFADKGSADSEGGMPYVWSDDYPARLGVLPRGQADAPVRWFDIAPCYIFHPYNAFEVNDQIILDVCRYPDLWRKHSADFSVARPYRFTIDLSTGHVGEQELFDHGCEFPRIDDRRTGRRARYGYVVGSEDLTNLGGSEAAIIKNDLENGTKTQWKLPAGYLPSEATFAPASTSAGEDEGWLLFYAYDQKRNASDLVILDAGRIEAGPIARVGLPGRVPFGFHGNWFPDQD